MKMTRFSRLLAAGIALFSLLFMQLAVAAYVCPASGTGSPAASVMAIDQSMPGCQGMQANQPAPALCAAHCDHAPQSADTPSMPAIAPFVQAALCVVLPAHAGARPVASLPDGFPPAATGAPPLIIRNCCFRI
jgi:hypothetical protein